MLSGDDGLGIDFTDEGSVVLGFLLGEVVDGALQGEGLTACEGQESRGLRGGLPQRDFLVHFAAGVLRRWRGGWWGLRGW